MENDRVSTISIIISIIVVFAGILGGWYFYSKRSAVQAPPGGVQAPAVLPITLTKDQIDNLISAMSASPTATPTLSKTQLEKLSKSMSASKTAEPVLSSDEQKKLIDAMSAAR